MKNAYSWDLKHLIRRLTLPHGCLRLQREAVPSVAAVWDRFPAVLFGCFQHGGDPSLAQRVVYPKFAFNQGRSQLLLVWYSVLRVPSNHLTADSHYNSTRTHLLATLFHVRGDIHPTKYSRMCLITPTDGCTQCSRIDRCPPIPPGGVTGDQPDFERTARKETRLTFVSST